MSENRTKIWTVMWQDRGNILTESWKKNCAERGEKSWQKFGKNA